MRKVLVTAAVYGLTLGVIELVAIRITGGYRPPSFWAFVLIVGVAGAFGYGAGMRSSRCQASRRRSSGNGKGAMHSKQPPLLRQELRGPLTHTQGEHIS